MSKTQPKNLLRDALEVASVKSPDEAEKYLLEKYGHPFRVFKEDFNRLSNAPALSQKDAVFLKMIPALAKHTHEAQINEYTLGEYSDIYSLLCQKTSNETTEIAYAVFVNGSGKRVYDCRVSNGTAFLSGIDIRGVIEIALAHKATGVFLAHNHPGGTSTPSNADMASTGNIIEAFKSVGITLADHIIVGENGFYSMANDADFGYPFNK